MAETEVVKQQEVVIPKTEVVKPRVHKVFGEYKKCKVSYKQPGKEKVSIFVSVNSYTLECQQDTEVEIPNDIIENLLKDATYTAYKYNKEKNTHESYEVKKYFVELI